MASSAASSMRQSKPAPQKSAAAAQETTGAAAASDDVRGAAGEPTAAAEVKEEAKNEEAPVVVVEVTPMAQDAFKSPDDITAGNLPVFYSADSMVAKHLMPTIFAQMHKMKTKDSFTFAQMIWPAVSHPRQEVGILPGDNQSYKKFREFLDPVIEELHGITMDGQSHEGMTMKEVNEQACWKAAVRKGSAKSWSVAEQRMVKHVRVEIIRNIKGSQLLYN